MNLKAVIDKNTNTIIAIVEDLQIDGKYILGSKMYSRYFSQTLNMFIYEDGVLIKDIEVYEIGKDNIEKLRHIAMIGLYSDDILIIIKNKGKEATDEEKELIKLIGNKIINYKEIQNIFEQSTLNTINIKKSTEYRNCVSGNDKILSYEKLIKSGEIMNFKMIVYKHSDIPIAFVKNLKIDGNYITGTKFYTPNFDLSPNMLIDKKNFAIKKIEVLKIDENINELKQKIIFIKNSDDVVAFVDCKNEKISKKIKKILDPIEKKIINYNSKLGIIKKIEIEINDQQSTTIQNNNNVEITPKYSIKGIAKD
jgi:hypothetical protein